MRHPDRILADRVVAFGGVEALCCGRLFATHKAFEAHRDPVGRPTPCLTDEVLLVKGCRLNHAGIWNA